MQCFLKWTAAFFVLLACLWIVAIAQAPSIKAPFATAPVLTMNTSVSVFFRTLNGSYVSIAYGLSTPFPVLSGMSALTELISEGVSNLLAGPAGPPNVGRASQMGGGGKFTSGGSMGAAYTTFEDNSLHVAVGTPGLLYNGTANYVIGPITAGLVAADFNGDGVLDVAITFLGDTSPGGLAVLINNGDGTLKSPVMYAPGASPISLAALDLNKDGILDLAVADNASSSVYVLLGNGDGSFKAPVAYPAGAKGLSITLADVDGDGNPDIAETAEDGNITILLNNGSGSFRAGPTVKTPSKTPFYIAAGDLNGDGRNDLVTADGYNSTVTIYLNTGGGNFAQGLSYATSFEPNSLVLADYNGDGKLDILNASGDARFFGPSANSGNIDLFLGNGDGTFQGPVVTPGGGAMPNPFLTVADFTGDGIPDAVVPGNGPSILLFPGTKSGVFKAPTVVSTGQISPSGGASGDFNGDGKPDLAIAGANSVGILLNTGAGFQTPSTFSSGGQGPVGIVAADFNHDGKLDLAVANSGSGTTAVFLGGGNGAFQLGSTYPTGTAPNQVLAADLNGDGNPDLVVLDPGNPGVSSGGLYVLINNGAGGFNAPAPYAPSNYPISAAAGDINGDGKPDLVVAVQDAQFNYHLAILLNTGGGAFAPAALINTEFGPTSIAIRDFNADGKADLVVAHCCGDTNMTYQQGNGDGTFSAEVDFNGGAWPRVMQVTDFNGDGAPDLAIFLSNGGTGNGMVGLLNNAKAAGSFSNLQAAGGSANIAQQAIVSTYAASGTHLSTTTATAPSPAWPTTLGGTTVSVLDSAGVARSAPIYYVSSSQVNYALPPGTALGAATVTITATDGAASSGPANIVAVSPGLFIVGTNLAAANVIRVSGGAQTVENDYMVDSSGNIVPRPIPLNPATDQVYLVLYGTGIRGAPLSAVSVTVASSSVPVQFAGAQQTYMGLDQVNMGPLPASLAGAGDVVVQLTASGIAANAVHITVQ